MRANQITGTTSDFKMGAVNHINYGVIQGFPALRRAVTTDVKKYRISISRVQLDISLVGCVHS